MFDTHKHRCAYVNNKSLWQLIQLCTGVFCIHTHHEKKLCSPNFSCFMDHSLKPLLLVEEVFLQYLSICVTLKISTKTSTTPCFPCSVLYHAAFQIRDLLNYSFQQMRLDFVIWGAYLHLQKCTQRSF